MDNTGTRRWKAIRDHVIWRDARTCQLRYEGCTIRATHVYRTREGKRLDLQLQAVCMSCRTKHRKLSI